MNKLLLTSALAVAFGAAAFVPQAARAADGTVTFNGKVLSSTCTVSNATGGNVAVTLPDVPVSNFTAQGSTAGLTPFSLNLTGCPTTPSGVVVGAAFSGASIDGTTGAIKNATGAGNSNVEVQMTNAGGTAVNLNTNPNPVNATISAGGTATLSYQAQYYQPTSTAVTAGTVAASVTYTLTYN
ncbi:fimbrial protein [Fulvimonas sp. R45]|uniref:fimbrial protein n=1 Tax=Fulvimonas sp. R45 TaxID=3045937 RepID=UPI00265D84AC|nr:fimbrial protein [Fulvimonas sp. R45]MDO1528967.1 fimbrial protein [Fulvimonas sp. R45]